jgi:predicted amidohydrolase YtcJ
VATHADTVYLNARIYTFDPSVPRAEALAVRDSRVLAVGSSADMRDLLEHPGRAIDLRGAAVLPGFVDCHVHLLWYGLGLTRVDLTGASSLEAALRRIEERAEQTPEGQWVVGRGWDESLWEGGEVPTRDDLDRVVADRPVAMSRKCGHVLWVNGMGLRACGIRAQTPDPPGGQIDRRGGWTGGAMRNATPGSVDRGDDRGPGEPTGILRENAMKLVTSVVDRPDPEQSIPALQTAIKMAHREGIVGVHAMEARESFQACQMLRRRGELDLRVLAQIPEESLEAALEAGLCAGFGDEWLRIGGVKAFADGSLGARTAAVEDPYQGEPRNRGILVADAERIAGLARRAAAGGLPLFVHAIGDRANRQVLDAFEALARDGALLPRHRIEHAQILRPEDVVRLARLGIVASVQPIHAVADMDIADRYLGPRGRRAYVFRDLIAAGVRVAFGSDAPVEDMSPLRGIHAAATRRRADGTPGPEGWYPEQRLTVAEAVAAYTVGAAYAGGDEVLRGSISPGKLADLVVLSRDIVSSPPEAILETRVLATVIGGRAVWGAEGLGS